MHKLTEEEIIEKVSRAFESGTETEKVEFKDARGGPLPKRLWQAISAFSNSPGGGMIVFGINNSDRNKLVLVGNSNLSDLQERVVSYVRENMSHVGEYSLKIFSYKGHELLALLISETPNERKPCYRTSLGMHKGACIRIGNTNQPLDEIGLRAYLRYSPEYKFDKECAPGTTTQFLNSEKIKLFLAKSAQRTNRYFPKSMPYEKVIKNLGIIGEFKQGTFPTYAGFIVFAKDVPQQLSDFTRYILRCVRYAGTTVSSPIIDQEDVVGTLDNQIDSAQKFVLRNIAVSARIVGTKRVNRYEYPEDAIREIIANALIHRDYTNTGTYIHINIFADRLEVSNPGTLPPGITIDNLKDSQFSRNEIIANLMRDLDYMEEFGRGIDLIYARMAEWELVEPLFKNSTNSFKVTLLGRKFKDLNDRQVKMWHYLQDNNKITASAASELFPEVSRATINVDLKGMVDMQLINVKGASSNTYYEPKY